MIASIPRFRFEVKTLPPDQALLWAMEQKEGPLFISDSGDNTTGGAVGEGTEMLKIVLKSSSDMDKRVLVTPICDPAAYRQCRESSVGSEINLPIGTDRDDISSPVEVTGIITGFGKALGYLNTENDEAGSCCVIRCGKADIIISDRATSFITPEHFTAAGTPLEEYHAVILKQGYLFEPLRPYSKGAVMALTGGATYQLIENLVYTRLVRPIYPFDRDFEMLPHMEKLIKEGPFVPLLSGFEILKQES